MLLSICRCYIQYMGKNMWNLLQNYKKYMVIHNQRLEGNITIFQKVIILKMFMDHSYNNKKKLYV
jgi:hypothetical protein